MLDHIGYFGPIILALMNVYYLFYRKAYLYAYIFFLFVNQYINKGLKLLIKEPRPQNQIPFLTKIDTIGVEKYGMPSGHAQSIGYSIGFLCNMISKTNNYFILALFIGLITLNQRYKYRRHSIPQLGIGLIIGLIFGNLVYYVTKYIVEPYKIVENKI